MKGRLNRNLAKIDEYFIAIKNPQCQTLFDLPGVYAIYFNNSDLMYIGSSKNVENRVISHTKSATNWHIRLPNLTPKKYKILEYTVDKTEAFRKSRELYYIEKYNTFYPNGFNVLNPITGKDMTK